MKKLILIVLCIIAATVAWRGSLLPLNDPDISMPTAESPATPPAKTLTIGWTGDMVPSSDPAYDLTVLDNVSNVLGAPDLMIGNLEGTFAHSGTSNSGDSSFADTLKAAGFDFISLINNHSLDYGNQGLLNTEAELSRVGLPYIAPNKPTASITINRVRVGLIGVSSMQPAVNITDYAYIAQTVQALKKNNDIVVMIFNGGAEGATKTQVLNTEEYQGTEDRGNVQAVAYTAINAGADLVLGDGPHVLRKVEWYNNKPIAYSLGNFVGGGHFTTTGNLGLGGIFTTTFTSQLSSANTTTSGILSPVSTNFTSVVLAKDGTPSIDPVNKSKQLLDSLSGPIK